MPDQISLVIVDDDSDFLNAYQEFFLSEPGFDCLGVAMNGRAGVALWRKKRPDVTLMDLSMPTMPGVDAIQTIRNEDPQAHVIALTSLGDSAHVDAALVAGAVGYLMKGCDRDELLQGVQDAYHGRMLLSAPVRETVTSLLQARRATPASPLLETFTPQEAEVLRLLTQGLSNQEMASKMFLSEASIKAYLNHLYSKLHVKSRNQLLIAAVNLGLVSVESLQPSL